MELTNSCYHEKCSGKANLKFTLVYKEWLKVPTCDDWKGQDIVRTIPFCSEECKTVYIFRYIKTTPINSPHFYLEKKTSLNWSFTCTKNPITEKWENTEQLEREKLEALCKNWVK